MTRSPATRLRHALVLAALAMPGAARAAGPQLQPPPGERLYHYEVTETQGAKSSGYRVDVRLATERDGGVLATVVRATQFDGVAQQETSLPADCAQALHAPPGALAQVRLFPLDAEAAKLGEAFMAFCAPPAVFFPMTDILNVVLIQASDRFAIGELAKGRRSARFAGFTTHLRRPAVEMAESSDEGEIALAGGSGGVSFVDWIPSPSRLEITTQADGRPVTLKGTEHFAIRLEVDRAGVMQRAATRYDDLDLSVSVPNLPPDKLPHVQIHRAFVIERRAGG
jgi:hypothetical protein